MSSPAHVDTPPAPPETDARVIHAHGLDDRFNAYYTIKSVVIIAGILATMVLPSVLPFLLLDILPAPFLFLVGLAGVGLVVVLVVRIFTGMYKDRFSFDIDLEGITVRFGLFTKQKTHIPYERVQHVAVHRGVFQRLFGLGTLMVQTAGFSGVGVGRRKAEGYINGIRDAPALAELVIQNVLRYAEGKPDDPERNATTGAPDTPEALPRPDPGARPSRGAGYEKLVALRDKLAEINRTVGGAT